MKQIFFLSIVFIFCYHITQAQNIDNCSRTVAFNAIKSVMSDYSTKNMTGGLANNANESMLTVTKGHVYYIQGKRTNTFCFYDCDRKQVYLVYGDIRDKWNTIGNEHGDLGLPLSSVKGYASDLACYFEHGAIYKRFNSAYAYVVKNEIYYKYEITEGINTNKKLGYPIADQLSVNNLGETSQQFEKGTIFLKRNLNTNLLEAYVKYNFEPDLSKNPQEEFEKFKRKNKHRSKIELSTYTYKNVQLVFDLAYFDKEKLMQLLQQAKSDYDNNTMSNSIRFDFYNYTFKDPNANHKVINSIYNYAFDANSFKNIGLNSPDTKITSISYNQQTNRVECMIDIVLFGKLNNLCFLVDINKIAECATKQDKEIFARTNCYGTGSFVLDINDNRNGELNRNKTFGNHPDFINGFYAGNSIYPHRIPDLGCIEGYNTIYFIGRDKTIIGR